MTDHPFQILDVFTDTPLAGNQLAVFTDGGALHESQLQPLAVEVGFSETVFVFPADGATTARIRIFTPASEIPFAGHPVLGTAVALGLATSRDEVILETGTGHVPVTLTARTANGASGRMRQPLPSVAAHPEPSTLLAALGVNGSTLPVEVYDNGIPTAIITLEDEAAIADLAPDMAALTEVARAVHQSLVSIYCVAGRGDRWRARMFAPAEGVPEDAATGSAAGPLAVHLARHGRIDYGQEIRITQGVEMGRPSTLLATAHGTADRLASVEVAGHAVRVAGGTFTLS